MKNEPDRIPYKVWANSQISVAKYYGGCKYNGKDYVLDYKNCEKKMARGEERYFPDLIEVVKPVERVLKKKHSTGKAS